MKSVDILFNVRPELAKCGHHLSVRDSETGFPVPDISDVGEWLGAIKEALETDQ